MKLQCAGNGRLDPGDFIRLPQCIVVVSVRRDLVRPLLIMLCLTRIDATGATLLLIPDGLAAALGSKVISIIPSGTLLKPRVPF